jgi:cytochrome P450
MTSMTDPGQVTCPFDHHRPEFRWTYRDDLARVRDAGPIVWSESHGGFWVCSSYPVVRRIAMDSEAFTVAPGPDRTGGLRIPTSPGTKTRPLFVPGEADGAEHDMYRLALNPHFSKARVQELAPMIDRHVTAVVDRCIARRRFDAVDDMIMPILAGIACEHLGLDVPDPVRLFKHMHQMIGSTAATGARFEEVRAQFWDSWSELSGQVKARRAEPRADVISALVTMTDPTFTDEQVEMMVLNVILGSSHTTASLLGQIVVHLADDEVLRERLRSNPELLPKAVDEFLRLKAVSIGVARTVTRDIEVEGVQLHRGDRVLMLFAGANHDPAKYADPTSFDLERGSAQHLAMGVGSHFCLGAWLAKAIVARTLRELLARVQRLDVDEEHVELAPEISNTFSYEHIPVVAVPRSSS